MLKQILSALAVCLVLSATSNVAAFAPDMQAVPQPMVKPVHRLDGAGGDPVLNHARSLLERGAAEDAYHAAISRTQSGDASAEMHVVAAKAALARVKTVTLLRKKRWAIRGRDQYQAALLLDAANEDALFGLATFALRAPTGLGGGAEGLESLRERLAGVSKPKSLWLEARVSTERNDEASALQLYEAAITAHSDVQLITEYFDAARKVGVAAAAYERLQSVSKTPEPCVAYALSGFAEIVGAPETHQLAHLSNFLSGQQRFCNREYVAAEAAQRAQDLARGLGLPEQQKRFENLAEQFSSERARDAAQSDIAS